ncbi:MAG: 4Fe-4S dicluster domain-containing protein [Candidatus Odinarchaeia archaeon]
MADENQDSVINLNQANFKLKETLTKILGGERLIDCYTCGACVGNCPVSKISDDFRPLKIIQQAILGLENELLNSPTIWQCAYCFTCQDVCPQDVKFPIMLYAIRKYLIEKGVLPELVVNFTKNVLKTARSIPLNDIIQDEREMLGLKEIKILSKVTSEVEKIMKKTGITKIIERT